MGKKLKIGIGNMEQTLDSKKGHSELSNYRKFTLISPGGQNKTATQTPIFRNSLPMNIYRNNFLYL